ISALTRDQMYSYFKQQYSPSNMVLSVAGNFDYNHLVELAEKFCGNWENHKVERFYPQYNKALDNHVMTRPDLQRAHVMLLAPGPDMRHEFRYEADVLTTILG